MKTLWLAAACLILAASGWAQSVGEAPLSAQVDSVYPQVETLYMDLHRHPELSLHEVNTAAKLAARLRELGYDVTARSTRQASRASGRICRMRSSGTSGSPAGRGGPRTVRPS